MVYAVWHTSIRLLRLHLPGRMLFVCLLIVALGAGSPTNAIDLDFRHLSVEQGLSQGSVRAILRDRFGFMWFGTYNGLNRYDGTTFTLSHQAYDSAHTENTSGIISALYEDRAGDLWIGTGGDGVQRVNRATGEITSYRKQSGNPYSLSNNIVFAIHEDRSGELWIGTANGLNRLNRQTGAFTVYFAAPENPYGLYNDQIQTIYEDSTGTLWIGALNGLHKFERDTQQFTRYWHDPNDPQSLAHNGIRAIYEDRNGVLWIGTNGGGLDRFDRETEIFTHNQHDSATPGSLSDDTVWAILEDHAGTLWVGTANGLNRRDPDTGQFTVYQVEPSNPTSLSHNEITALYEDPFGMLWIGTAGGGVNTCFPTIPQFRRYTAEPDNPDSLSVPDVNAILEDQSGNLWVGLKGGGLNRIDRRNGQVTHYQPDQADPRSLSDAHVSALHEDAFGVLWIGTERGLNRFEAERNQFTRFLPDPKLAFGLSHASITAIIEDRPGVLWIGTRNGLNLFNTMTGLFRSYRHDPGRADSLGHNDIRCLYQDREGVLWIGTFGGGLNVFDPQHDTFAQYRHHPDDPGSLSYDVVFAIYEDVAHQIWIGTSQGLDRFDRATRKFAHYGKDDGLPDAVVLSILPDNAGNLWIGTPKGLSKFDPRQGTFTNYNAYDGLQGNRFNQAAFRSHSGELFFGGVQGLTVFSPEQIRSIRREVIPPLALTAFTQSGVPFADSPPEVLRNVRLPWDANFFEFRFAVLSYRDPSKNQYAYRLAGFEKEWNPAWNMGNGRYNNLPPGTYQLQMKGATPEGVWNEEWLTLAIQVAAPPWKRWWAYSLYVAVPGLLVFGYVRYTLQHRQLEEAIRLIAVGTASATGDEFFRSLTRCLASALRVRYVLVAECVDAAATQARTLAFWTGQTFAENFSCAVDQSGYFPRHARTLLPDNELVLATEAEGYVQTPLMETSGTIIGYLIVLHPTPIKNKRHTLSVLNIFAARAEAELARKRVDDNLKISLHEKDLLLKEIHHRVKNNLQIISSLLGMQSVSTKIQALAPLLKESQNRVKAMALMHEKLYRSANLAQIDFAQYIRDLGASLMHAYGIDPQRITLTVQAESVALNIDTALPCGMILNELVSNALKHAFPPGKCGEIRIALSITPDHQGRLRVQDTGVGLPETSTIERTESLGLKLVKLFTEQLNGTLDIRREQGTIFTITFPL